MIQFSKPRRTLAKAMDQFRRHETNARDFFPTRNSGTPSRFDASFYRTHDAVGYIPSDVQSLRSQATYSSGLPMFTASGPFSAQVPRGPGGVGGGKRQAGSVYGGSYASSIISQDLGPTQSVVGGERDMERTSMISYNQSDRVTGRGVGVGGRMGGRGRRPSFGSSSVTGASDVGSTSMGGSQYDYKSQGEDIDLDDVKSQYTGTQGVTVF
ncbi:hypothetical protein L218DRAFT_498636 [Marasmius fiardii PR-910]|nr:hypothetical protein L218DRAFT_498636 [Marasmius fiardii PR-910]